MSCGRKDVAQVRDDFLRLDRKPCRRRHGHLLTIARRKGFNGELCFGRVRKASPQRLADIANRPVATI